MDTQIFLSTRVAAQRLGVNVSRLGRAVWTGKIAEPARGPSGAFLWTEADLERASWALLGRPLADAEGER